MDHRLLTLMPLAALLLAMPAAAQTGSPAGTSSQTGVGNPTTMPPGTPQAAPGVAAPHQPNQADRTFIREAAIGGMAEVDFAKLAEQKGQSDAVKRFAQRMIQDHTKANDQLAALANAANVPMPNTLDEEHRSMRAALEKASGASFDRAYIQGQMADHAKTAQLFEYEIGSGQDAGLKTFAADTLPVVLQHLQLAQGIAAEMTGAMSQDAGLVSGSTVPPPRQ